MVVEFRATLPDPADVARIFELRKAGLGPAQIGLRVYGSHARRHRLIKTILANPHDFDPYVDRVAVDRALQGDTAVWESLTHYERREAMLAIHQRHEREKAENAADLGSYDNRGWRRSGGWGYVAPNPVAPDWLMLLCDSFGIGTRRLWGEVRRYAEAA